MRSLLALLLLLALVISPAACSPGGDEDVGSSEDALTFEPSVNGSVNGQIKPLTAQQALDLRFVSYDKILTWEGLVEDFGKPAAKVHLVDTTKFDGHLGYTKNGIGRGASYTENNFFTEIQFPATRKYMPFLVFDFRTQPIRVNGKLYKWVMNIRRYNYRDTDAQLANNILKPLRALLSEKLMKNFGEPLLFVYDTDFVFPSTGTLRRPHLTKLTEVRAAGFADVTTENDMIAAAGGELVSVLNPGVAYGHLKLVRAPQAGQPETDERLTPRHIAVFEDTPERVPPSRAS